MLVDGAAGLFTDGAASYDAITLLTNDPKFVTTAVDDVVMTEMNTSMTIEVLSNDAIFDQVTAITSVTTQSVNGGTVTFDAATGTVTYTAATNYAGEDTFTYTITDDEGETSIATVTVYVIDPNELLVEDAITVAENSSVTFDVLGNYYPESGQLDSIYVFDANNGVVELNSDVTITYTANAGFVGRDEYTYILIDSDGNMSAVTVYVDVG